MAHITGGGLVENIPRVLDDSLQCVVKADSWKRPAIFDWLQEKGNIDSHEMHRVFNNGIGMAVIVSPEDADRAEALFKEQGETVYRIGGIVRRPEGAPGCIVI